MNMSYHLAYSCAYFLKIDSVLICQDVCSDLMHRDAEKAPESLFT